MGIDAHSLNLLRYAYGKYGKLGRAITLGRLTLQLGPRACRKLSGLDRGSYCEPFLSDTFGASCVDSIDNSNYEGATIVADMNLPAPEFLNEQYDTVIDFGCTEHIYNVAQSFQNISRICKPNGTILHAVPSNGCCGHGFYQFSPELFFSRYSNKNGFRETEVFLADQSDLRYWYRVAPPHDGNRINVRSMDEVYVLVVTRRIASANDEVQQSDYEFTWDEQARTPGKARTQGRLAWIKEILGAHPFTARPVNRIDSWLAPNGARSLKNHPELERIPAGFN